MKITLSNLVEFVKNSDRISTQGFTECLNNKSRTSGNVSTLCSRILALSRTPPREVPWNRQSRARETETFTVTEHSTDHKIPTDEGNDGCCEDNSVRVLLAADPG